MFCDTIYGTKSHKFEAFSGVYDLQLLFAAIKVIKYIASL